MRCSDRFCPMSPFSGIWDHFVQLVGGWCDWGVGFGFVWFSPCSFPIWAPLELKQQGLQHATSSSSSFCCELFFAGFFFQKRVHVLTIALRSAPQPPCLNVSKRYPSPWLSSVTIVRVEIFFSFTPTSRRTFFYRPPNSSTSSLNFLRLFQRLVCFIPDLGLFAL